MECYECLQVGIQPGGCGLGHHCSAALCPDHICVVDDPVAGGVFRWFER